MSQAIAIQNLLPQLLVRRRIEAPSGEDRTASWRCQSCGTMSNLEVHHKQFRSHSGHDSEENLITLCSTCHASVHQPPNTWEY
jgi:5-methylcytosine-specific restriction endonuclease McrA